MTIKKLSIKLSILITFIIVISLSACLGDWQSNSAKIVISFGGAARAVYNPNDSETLQKLEHKIVLTNAAETLNFSAAGVSTFEANVAPGNWNVSVVSYLDGDVYAAGSKDVILISGLNNETITMYEAHLVKFVSNGGSAVEEQVIYHAQKINYDDTITSHPNDLKFIGWYDSIEELFDLKNKLIFESITLHAKWEATTVSPKEEGYGNSLSEKLRWIHDKAVDGGNYIVEVTTEETLNPISSPYVGNLYYGGISVNITLKSSDNTTKFISLGENKGTLFTVGSGVTLTLDNYITLQGNGNNNKYSLIMINSGGTLEMKALSKITGNKIANNGGWQAGVYIQENARFIMNGGEISDNTAEGCGGVWVAGTFTMNGGKISGNKVYGNSGGGVWVCGGTFTMNGGEISGNTAEGNDGGESGGVHMYKDNGKQGDERIELFSGTFIMNGGEISGNNAWGGGGVSIHYGNFTMNGGKISGNKATKWSNGGVLVKGTFNMSGGEIYKNTADQAGGVRVEGTFNMTGGKIYGHTTTKWDSGGVFVEANGEFNMSDGKIYNNEGTHGGGVNVDGKFTMTGGEIYQNKATVWGGAGVMVGGGRFTMGGGKIYKNIAYDNGGGVNVSEREEGEDSEKQIFIGTFNMNGGNIYENKADYGGGISVFNSIFNKAADPNTGGKIEKNTANNNGNQVWADRTGGPSKTKENDIRPNTYLNYNGTNGGFGGAWDN